MDQIEECVQQHISHTEKILSDIGDAELNEEATKRFLIQPFLENVLGWPMSTVAEDGYVSSEYATEIVNQNKYMDYVLLDSTDSLQCIVETKRGDENLKEKHKNQIKDYMKNEGVIWGILTNGTEFCFYVRDDQDSLIEKEINHITYSSLDNYLNLLQVYFFESLINGTSETLRKEILDQYRRQQEFDKEETKNTLYDLLDPKTASEKELIESFVTDFSEEIEHSQFVINNTETDHKSTTESSSKNRTTKELINEQTSVQVTENNEVIFDESKTASGSLEEVVEVLFKTDKITESDIPYKIKSSHSRYLFNSKPVDSEGDPMKRPEEVIDSVFIECNRSTEDCKSTIISITENF